MIFHVIVLLWTNQQAITLFCTNTGTKSAIACSLVRNFHSIWQINGRKRNKIKAHFLMEGDASSPLEEFGTLSGGASTLLNRASTS